MSSEEAVNTVREIFQSGEPSILKAAEEMIDIALDKGEQFLICSGFFFPSFAFFSTGSKDNISSILVRLPGAVIGPESNGGVDGRRKQRGVQFDPKTGSPMTSNSNDISKF
jgi:hypothetical protein